MKKVSIGRKPERGRTATPEAAAEAWVTDRQESGTEKMKRLTIDVPPSLHHQIKVQCALDGVKMADVVRELLEAHFSAESRN